MFAACIFVFITYGLSNIATIENQSHREVVLPNFINTTQRHKWLKALESWEHWSQHRSPENLPEHKIQNSKSEGAR